METASADEVSSISNILELMYTDGKHAAMMAGMNQVVVLKFSGLKSR
jgi:trehalose/maltose hydrolase-like predicted phosphorylase